MAGDPGRGTRGPAVALGGLHGAENNRGRPAGKDAAGYFPRRSEVFRRSAGQAGHETATNSLDDASTNSEGKVAGGYGAPGENFAG